MNFANFVGKTINYMNLRAFLLIVAVAIYAMARASVIDFPGSESASIGIYIADVRTGRVVASHNAATALVPASTLKAVTAATALTMLDGRATAFVTEVFSTGSVDGYGRLSGDIVVKGVADPTLGSRHFTSRPGFISSITNALTAKGIKDIAGGIVVEPADGYPGVPLSWEVEDIGESYGAGLYGFNWRDNYFSMPAVAGVHNTMQGVVECHVVEDARANAVVRGVDSDIVTVYCRRGAKAQSSIDVSMWAPWLSFTNELTDSLAFAGIAAGDASAELAGSEHLLSYKSPTVSDILSSLMRRSDNLMAEGMLRLAYRDAGSLDSALVSEKQLWREKANISEYTTFCDGSGLSRKNRISPASLAAVLKTMLSGKQAQQYVSLFPRCGREGTVARFLKGTRLQGRAVLKSGSMSGVQCYAGYLLGADKTTPEKVVVVMINGIMCRGALVRKAIEDYLLKVL